MHEDEQTERNQRERDVFRKVGTIRSEVPETDTSRAKTLTVLQRACTSEQTVSRGAVDVSELSSRSDDRVSVSEYCADKL